MYPTTLREEELKNRVAVDVFGDYDCARILGAVDFCVSPRAQATPGNLSAEPQSRREHGDSISNSASPRLRVEKAGTTEDESLLWAEAKTGVRDDFAPLFAQLVLTLGKARTFDQHLPPPFLGAFDCEKIAFVPYHEIVDLFYQNDFNWNVAPSDETTREFGLVLERVRPLLDANLRVFRFDEDAVELDAFVRKALRQSADGKTASLNVTRNNFVFVYQKWARDVKPSIAIDWDNAKRRGLLDADFFLADLLSKDGATLVEKLYVVLRGDHYDLDRTLDEMGLLVSKRAEFNDGQKAHAQFWNRYRRPPKKEYWGYISERRDLLVPQDVRERKGSFFTPQIWVEKAQESIAAALGENWQDEYDVWDCAAGTGNLLAGLQNKYKVWASTLDRADVEVMRERIKNGANLLDSHVFQFDFLNGSFDDLPEGLRAIVRDPERRKKLVVFINPPYAEAASTRTKTGTGANKPDVARTVMRTLQMMMLGRAMNEIFAQFLIRISTEIPGCIIGQFSKLKHLQGPNFWAFRKAFHGRIEKCFIVPADTFDNVKGQFPIGFFVWRLWGNDSRGDAEAQSTGGPRFVAASDGTKPVPPVFTSTVADVYDRGGEFVGTKAIFAPDGCRVLMDWIRQFYDKAGEHLAYCRYLGSDFQNNSGVFITLSPSANDLKQVKGNWITPANIWQFCVYFAVRHCIEADWLNDRDQFLWPSDTWKTDGEFQLDCLVFTLFHGQNRISCKAGVNHWIPFPESEVDAKDAYKSHFMVNFLKCVSGRDAPMARPHGRFMETSLPDDLFAAEVDSTPSTLQRAANGGASTLSMAASRVLDAGKRLWRYYHSQPNALPDASFYDIRAHFQGFKPNGHMNPDSPDAEYTRLIGDLRAAMKSLAAKLAPKVHEHGFLR